MTERDDHRIRTYLALGDSFSEGLMDESALEDGRFIGWADRFAHALTQSPVGSPDLLYANHAIRGRQLGAIIDEQVPVALDLKPDLVSFVAGGNDVLRPAADVDGLAEQLERAISAMRAEGIEVLLGNGFDTAAFSPALRALRPRVAVYNAHMWTLAGRHGCYMLDLWGMRPIYAQEYWAPDRIHLSTQGHTMVAQSALGVLEEDRVGIRGFRLSKTSKPLRDRMEDEAEWLKEHLAPWVGRRLRGTSSGAYLDPKYPEWVRAAELPLEARSQSGHHVSPAAHRAAADDAASADTAETPGTSGDQGAPDSPGTSEAPGSSGP